MAAKAQGIGDGQIYLRPDRLVGDIVQIALGIGTVQIDGGRDDAGLQSLQAGDGFDGARCTQHMARHGLGGADEGRPGIFFTQGLLDGQGLRHVVQGRAGAVGIDVDRFGAGIARLFQGLDHRSGTAVGVGPGGR